MENLSTQSLAYIGDAVFELLVREKLLSQGSKPVHALHRAARQYVSAAAQAGMYKRIFPFLTEEEQAVMRRGRNLHAQSRAKNASVADYRYATGLETLFGFLHVAGERDRLVEVFGICVDF